MKNKYLTVVATFQAQLGKEAALQSLLTGLLAPTRQEPGCLNYDLHQSLEDPTKFLFYENWTSQQELDQHMLSSHVQAALPLAAKLCTQPPDIRAF